MRLPDKFTKSSEQEIHIHILCFQSLPVFCRSGGLSETVSVCLWPVLLVTSSEFSTQPANCSKWPLHWSDSSESLPHRASISLPEQGSSQELSLPLFLHIPFSCVHHLFFFFCFNPPSDLDFPLFLFSHI